jgi:hypothetical protein
VSAYSMGEAVERLKAGDFDLVILGSFIPAREPQKRVIPVQEALMLTTARTYLE